MREGANVTLTCRANGSPKPTMKWKRDDNSKISISRGHSGKIENIVIIKKDRKFHGQSQNVI